MNPNSRLAPESVTIALDAMSGDRGPDVVVGAAERALDKHPALCVILVGTDEMISACRLATHDRVRCIRATEIVTMDDAPADAVRRKKDSSMRLAINTVAEGEASACVSAGNTGALMATAKFVLKTVPGIKRPAIMAQLPTRDGSTFMLDVGANASCDDEQLFQFAIMGSVVAGQLLGVQAPRVALLNIGSEQGKGDDRIRATAARIEASGLNYVGFVEGNDLGHGVADVVVTDGFTGNVALKTMEGTASLVGDMARRSFTHSWWSRVQALVAGSALRRLRGMLDPRRYNGASLVGLNGIVVKSHGGADELAFEHAIETALLEVEENAPAAINRGIESEAA